MTIERNPDDLDALMNEALGALEGAARIHVPDAIPTGITSLDEILGGGLRPGTVNQLAGRGSTGKTCLGLEALRAAAFDNALPALHVTFEEDHDGITRRLVAARCGIPKDHLYRPERFTSEDRAALTPEKRQEIATAPYRVAHDVDTITDIEAAARDYDGVRLITIDSAIALVPGLGENANAQYDELGLRLRALARETGAAILIITAIPSVHPEHSHRTPTNADRRAATCLDSVCDAVLLLHLHDDDPRQPWVDDILAEIHVIKRRNGPIGTARAVFQRAYGTFRDLTGTEEADPWMR